MSTLAVVLLSVAYTTAALVTARMIAGHIAWTWLEEDRIKYNQYRNMTHPDSGKWFGAWLIGLLLCPLWPMILVVVKIPTNRLAVGAEAKAQAKEREEYVARLEKELDLHD